MVSSPPSRSSKKQAWYEPTPAAVEILHALAQFHYLTVEQVVRLFYKPGTTTTVQTRMLNLFNAGFCERRALPLLPMNRGGSAPFVYTLGQRGRVFADARGWVVPARFRPSEIPQKNQLAHIVACSDVYIAAALLCRNHPTFGLERLVHERTLRGQTERVQVNGKPRRVTPDGWFSVMAEENGKRFRYPIALEVDLGTERQQKWRDKVRGLIAWIDGPYPKLFSTPHVTVAVVSPGKAKHATVLRAWTEAELSELKRRQDAKHFLFIGANPAVVAPEDFFLKSTWHQPFRETGIPLVEVDGE